MVFFTYLGDWRVIVGLSIVSVAVLWSLRKKQEAIFFAVALISGEIIKEFLKLLFHRQRPSTNFALISESGYSFPSGHAFMSIIFYGMICFFVYKLCQNKWQKFFLLFVSSTFIFLIGLSRIYLGVHWASDVLAGWIIGGAILAFFIVKLKNIKS